MTDRELLQQMSDRIGKEPWVLSDNDDNLVELHLGGFETEQESSGTSVIIDTHSQPIDAHAWDLYGYTVRRFGMRPTLIEWDNAVPAIDTLLAEAAKAEAVAIRSLDEVPHALAG